MDVRYARYILPLTARRCILNISRLKSLFTSRTISGYKATKVKVKGKSTSSKLWLRRQQNDPYVMKAKEQKYRCRSAFKLLEIDDKYKIFNKRDVVIDCGAAPGSWTQVAVERCGHTTSDEGAAQVIGIDMLDISPVPGAISLSRHDFMKKETQDTVADILKSRKANVVLSDMAPNASGIKSMDHQLIIELCFSVLNFSVTHLEMGGTMLCKVWQGGELHKLEKAMKTVFGSVRHVKPNASRSDSAELFLLGRGYKCQPATS